MKYSWVKISLWGIIYGLFSISLCGCLVRTYTVEKPRVDMQVKGNQGYLIGQGSGNQCIKKTTNLRETRKISVMEIEFGQHGPREGSAGSKETKTNFSCRGDSSQDSMDDRDWQDNNSPEPELVGLGEEKQSLTGEYLYYQVEKKDTLQKISSKFYGTTKKWKSIYNYNSDILKGPDKIYPGQKIKIPVLDKNKEYK